MIVHVLYWIAFAVAMICFPATVNVDARRAYGRIFNTRINTKIYRKIFYSAIACVCILFVIIFLMG